MQSFRMCADGTVCYLRYLEIVFACKNLNICTMEWKRNEWSVLVIGIRAAFKSYL